MAKKTKMSNRKNPCWKGYEMIGMKPGKGGGKVLTVCQKRKNSGRLGYK